MRHILLIAIVCFSTACTVGPNYQRPSLATPQSFRAPDPLPPGQADSFADLKWFEVFKDEQLQALIRHALQRNYDLRDAVARVEEARAALGITRSDQFPSFGAGGAVEINRLSREGATPLPRSSFPRRIGISEPPRCSCFPSKSISGANCAAPPRPRAPIS